MGREIPCVEATPTLPRSSLNNCRGLGGKRQSLSRGWSFRRTAAPAGRWLYLGTNCLARRFTSSVVKTRPGEGVDEFLCELSIILKQYSTRRQRCQIFSENSAGQKGSVNKS